MDLDFLYTDDPEDYEYDWQYINNKQVSALFTNCIFRNGYLESRR